eukprot:jgi/Bigna1/90195/estExt_fgenesh1_pg.C_650007
MMMIRSPEDAVSDHQFKRGKSKQQLHDGSLTSRSTRSTRTNSPPYLLSRSADFLTPNAENESMIEMKQRLQEEDIQKKLDAVKKQREKNKMKRLEGVHRGKPKFFKVGSIPRTTSRNAETQDMREKKIEKSRLERKRMFERVAARRSGLAKAHPSMRFAKDKCEDLRNRNAPTAEELRLKRQMLDEEEQRRQQIIESVKKGNDLSLRALSAGKIVTSDGRDPELVTPNADTREIITQKLKALADMEKERHRKVKLRREEAKLRRSSFIDHEFTEEEEKMLGKSSANVDPSAALACKHFAVKVKQKMEKSLQRRRSSLCVMKDRTEGWMSVNGDSPEIIRAKKHELMLEEKHKLQNLRKEKLRRDQAWRLRSNAENSSMTESLISSETPKRIIRVKPDRSKAFETFNADDDRILKIKKKAQEEENELKLQKVRERRREAQEAKEARRQQMHAALSTKRSVSPKLRNIYSSFFSEAEIQLMIPMLDEKEDAQENSPKSAPAFSPSNRNISPKGSGSKATRKTLRKARTPTISISTKKKFVWGISKSNTHMKEKSPYSSSKPGIRAKKNSPVTRKGNKKKSSGVRITNNELTEVETQQRKFESWLSSFDY